MGNGYCDDCCIGVCFGFSSLCNRHAQKEGWLAVNDLISRQAAIEAAIEAADEWDGGSNWQRAAYIKDGLWKLPSVQPERPRGRWIEQDGYDGDTYYDCSVCGNSWATIEGTLWENGMNFCPHCGADMRGEIDG